VATAELNAIRPSMRVVNVETRTHGRVLIQEAADSGSGRLLVAFHGYGQSAEDVLADVVSIPGASVWRIAAVQALHRFYTRGDEKVIASWMTRQDRELAIADNVAYVDRTLDAIAPPRTSPVGIVFAGFSQGAAMAYRAALGGRHRATGILALGGDLPPDVKTIGSERWPAVLIGAGDSDPWYTPVKVDADAALLTALGVSPDVVRFHGGHEWTPEFRTRAGQWLAAR
jgi:predicted esterase